MGSNISWVSSGWFFLNFPKFHSEVTKTSDFQIFQENTRWTFPFTPGSQPPLKKKRWKSNLEDENLTPTKNQWDDYPVIWKIPGLFSSPISREIDHP